MRLNPALLLAAIAVLLYGRTVTFGFVHADDVDLIAGNQTFLRDLSRIPEAFGRSYFETDGDTGTLETYYRPVAIVSFMLDAQSGGAQPAIYHATNVAVHIVSVLLLFQLLTALGTARRTAFLVALLFAVHPLHTQTVAWIAGRNELLFGAFTLMALWTYVEYGRTLRVAWLAVHGLAFALAVFSKETAAILPFGLALHAFLFDAVRPRQAGLLAGVQVVVLAIWWTLRAQALAGSTAVNATLTESLTQSWQVLSYVGKLFVPVPLNVMPGPERLTLVLGAIALILWVAALRAFSAKRVIFALVWLLLFVSPSVLVPGLPAYEHRMYVPMMGLAIATAGSTFTAGVVRAGLVVALIFGVLSFLHAPVFRDAPSYWSNGTSSPRFAPIAHVNLGQLREQAGDLAGAAEQYRRALALDAETPKARNNLGVVLMQQKRPTEAVALFHEEVRRFPQNAEAWFNLGLWAEMQGDVAEARRHYERALAENPAYRPAADKLGRRTP